MQGARREATTKTVGRLRTNFVQFLARVPFFVSTIFALVFAAPMASAGVFTALSEPAPEDIFGPLPDEFPASPAMAETERLRMLKHHEVLADPLGRISPDFHIPAGLDQRVAFWLDVYTRFDRKMHVIHHSRYPWIIFEILDLTQAINQGSGPEWLRFDRASRYVKNRRTEIRKILLRLSRRPNNPQNEFEEHLLNVLSEIPGSRRKILSDAAIELRSQLGQRDFFIQGLRRSSRYLPYMEEVLLQADLPLDLARLPFVESSFNEDAESKVGASGIWQVMPSTGKAYGLVNESIDERNSPLKATAMAARLLRGYFGALKSWPLTITAYNHGIGNIQHAIRAARSRDLPTIIRRYHRGDFKFASSNFYSCFLAALFAERYSEVVFPSIVRKPVLSHERFTLAKSTKVSDLLKWLDLPSSTVLAFNQDISAKKWRSTVLPKGYVISLPEGKAQEFLANSRGRLRPTSIPATRISDIEVERRKRKLSNPG